MRKSVIKMKSVNEKSDQNPLNEVDDEEDYMSADLLGKIGDIRPGIACNNPSIQRKTRIEKERAEANLRNRQQSVGEMEKRRREEALARPVGVETKGFAMLSKMGYKPGMLLGKQQSSSVNTNDNGTSPESGRGLKEPINVDLKLDRTGLGHDTEQKRRASDRIELHCAHMAKRAKMTALLTKDFRQRKKTASFIRNLIGDIIKSRRVCRDLDERLGLELPIEPWFWPSYSSGLQVDTTDDEIEPTEQFHYANEREAPIEPDFNEMDEQTLRERLTAVTDYLRRNHLYCIWCGQNFDSEMDLIEQCPGGTRSDHDEDDYE